jgi:hypothetical protein
MTVGASAKRLVPTLFDGKNIRSGSRPPGGWTVDVAPILAAAASEDHSSRRP